VPKKRLSSWFQRKGGKGKQTHFRNRDAAFGTHNNQGYRREVHVLSDRRRAGTKSQMLVAKIRMTLSRSRRRENEDMIGAVIDDHTRHLAGQER